MTTRTGTVTRFNGSQGYRIFAREGGGTDLFAHLRDIQGGFKTLAENQHLEFDARDGRKGLQAANVRAI